MSRIGQWTAILMGHQIRQDGLLDTVIRSIAPDGEVAYSVHRLHSHPHRRRCSEIVATSATLPRLDMPIKPDRAHLIGYCQVQVHPTDETWVQAAVYRYEEVAPPAHRKGALVYNLVIDIDGHPGVLERHIRTLPEPFRAV